MFIVSAGSEDLEFINLFPYWRDNNDVTRINNVSYYYTHTHTHNTLLIIIQYNEMQFIYRHRLVVGVSVILLLEEGDQVKRN